LRRIIHLLLLIALLCQISITTNAYSPVLREYQIKSAFMANFIRYTHWQSMPTNNFQFCMTSTHASDIVSKSLQQERWFDLTTQFSLVAPGEEGKCHFLFVDQSSHELWQPYLSLTKVKNLLVVSEQKDSAQQYSQINFFFVDNKLRFEINPSRLQGADLAINASLLRLARIVNSRSLVSEGRE